MHLYALHAVILAQSRVHIQRENLLKVSEDNTSGLGPSVWRSISWPASGGELVSVWSPDKID